MIRNAELNSRKAVSLEVFGVLYFAVIVAAGIMLVWQPARVASMNQELGRLEATLRDLKMRNEDLKRTVATMESLTFIEAQARDVLGMVDPVQVRALAVNTEYMHLSTEEELGHITAMEPGQTGILGWINRIAQFMKNSIAVAKAKY